MDEPEDQLWAIILVSSAMKDVPAEEAERFLADGRKARTEKNVTGLVLMTLSNVLILEEGPMKYVKETYEAAKRHPTHHSIIKLYDGPIESRLFTDFPLAFKPLGYPELNHLNDFSSGEMREYLQEILSYDSVVAKLIKDFIKNNQ